MKTYIVTGGAGFVGSGIAQKLVDLGHKVIIVDNLSTGKAGYIPKGKNVIFRKVDISDSNALSKNKKFFLNADGIFHCAALSRIQPSISNPDFCMKSNIQGTLNVLNMMREYNIPNIVYSASSSSYGLKNSLPNKETQPPDCRTPYASSKYACEVIINSYGVCYGLKSVCLKYFNVYGERSPMEGSYAPVIGIFFKQAMTRTSVNNNVKGDLTIVGDGEQRRDFTFIEDVVEANIKAMNKLHENPEDVNGLTINIGCGKNYSINEIADDVISSLKEYGIKNNMKKVYIPARIGESRETLADISLAKEKLGWEPKTSLKDGIKKLVPFYAQFVKQFIKDSPQEEQES